MLCWCWSLKVFKHRKISGTLNNQQGIAGMLAAPTMGSLLNSGNPGLSFRQKNTEIKGKKKSYHEGI